jgi:hypothetical protein
MVRNASNVPVTQLVFDVTLRTWPNGRASLDEPLGSQLVGLVPPGSEPQFVPFQRDIAEVLRRARRTHEGEPVDHAVDVDVRFRDAGGRFWIRTADGELEERDPSRLAD